MATKKQSSGKQSKPESVVAEAPAGDDTIHVEPATETPDFAALESRVAQAEQGYAAAVSSVGATADELREARAALREARGG